MHRLELDSSCTRLAVDPHGRGHFVVSDRYGVPVALRLSRQCRAMGAEVEVLLWGEQQGLPDSVIRRCSVLPSQDDLLSALEVVLSTARMGLRLYIAGTESFVWTVNEVATRYGLHDDEIRRQPCGPRWRRVFCVLCGTVMTQVSTDRVRCDGCGRPLELRDHFSRRLGAYMGVYVEPERRDDRSTPGAVSS